MRFGFFLDDPPLAYTMPTHLTVRCAGCGQHKSPIHSQSTGSSDNTICKECADKLIHAKRLYEA